MGAKLDQAHGQLRVDFERHGPPAAIVVLFESMDMR